MMERQAVLDLGSLVKRVLVKSILLESKAARSEPHLPCGPVTGSCVCDFMKDVA